MQYSTRCSFWCTTRQRDSRSPIRATAYDDRASRQRKAAAVISPQTSGPPAQSLSGETARAKTPPRRCRCRAGWLRHGVYCRRSSRQSPRFYAMCALEVVPAHRTRRASREKVHARCPQQYTCTHTRETVVFDAGVDAQGRPRAARRRGFWIPGRGIPEPAVRCMPLMKPGPAVAATGRNLGRRPNRPQPAADRASSSRPAAAATSAEAEAGGEDQLDHMWDFGFALTATGSDDSHVGP